jgi:DNA-binding NtrC family response regulator
MEHTDAILVIDDEKNIRTTLQQVLESAGYKVATAVNGEDGLSKLAKLAFDVVLLDMKLPGMDGIDVLRRMRENNCETPVAIITAYGTIENAVEAMKLGAVDYLRKPFSGPEIKELVERILARPRLDEGDLGTYAELMEQAKLWINRRDFRQAERTIHKALALDSSRAEAFNLLGVCLELRGERLEAQRRYRAAVGLDPTYEPARANLSRTTRFDYSTEGIDKGDCGGKGKG